MVTVHNENAKRFDNMGLAVIDDIILSCKPEEKINEYFHTTLSVVIDQEEKYKILDYERIIYCPTPRGEEPFRIKDIIKTNYTIEVFARHLMYDIENDIVEDTNVVAKNCAGALLQVKNALNTEGKNFNFYSDIESLNNARIVRKYGMSAILSNEDNSIINRWGGEAEFIGNNFYLRKRRGQDSGFKIQYKKNITGFNAKISTDSVGTMILAQGFDGLFLSDNPSERYVNSPLINNYKRVYKKHMQYSYIKVKDDPTNDEEEGFNTIEEARAALRKAVEKDFENGLDKPVFTATVNFILSQDTLEYSHTGILENVYLGDTVDVDIEKFGIVLKQRMTSYIYDSMTRKYVSTELGLSKDNFYQSIKDDIKDSIPVIPPQKDWEERINQAVQEATNAINHGLGGFTTKTRSEYLIMDTESISTAQKLWRWNIGGLGFSRNGYKGQYATAITADGKFVISEATAEKFTGALIEAGTIKAEALTVESKMELREGLVTNSQFEANNESITSKVEKAEEVSNTATTTATRATEEARKAQENALLGIENAKLASNKADTAQGHADQANEQANTANTLLSDIASDTKCTPNEKQATKKEFEIITGEKDKIIAEASKFGLTYISYEDSYLDLKTYLHYLFGNMNVTSTIDSVEYTSKFTTYYNSRQDLLNSISSKVKSLADTAKTQADKGVADAKLASDKAVAANTSATQAIADAKTAKAQADKGVADAKLASDKAIAAQSKADSAKIQADKGVADALSANNKLTDISSDNKFTASEKQSTKKDWDIIVGEKPKMDAEASKFGVVTTDYTAKYNTLNTYITPLLANLTATSDIVGTTFRTNFTNYYNSRQDLLNSISTKAKSLADNAQSQANTAKTQADKGVEDAKLASDKAIEALTSATSANAEAKKAVEDARLAKIQADKGVNDAKTAQTKADAAKTQADKGVADAKLASDKAVAAQSKADSAKTQADKGVADALSANNKLTDISSDNKFTASEKQSTKKDWDIIVGEKPKMDAEASKFGVVTTDYTAKYNTLNTYITPLLSNLTVTSDIVGTTFRTNFTNYYNSRQDLLNAISTKAKSLADNAQSQANTAKTQADKGVNDAKTAQTKADTAKTQADKGVADAKTASDKALEALNKAKEVDGKVVDAVKRITTAESKITDTAITNTVKASTTSNGKPTFAQTATVEHLVDQVKFDFTNSGGGNLLFNSKASNGVSNWYSNGGGITAEADGVMGTCFKMKAPTGIYHDWVKLKNSTYYIYEGYIYSRQAIVNGSSIPMHFWCCDNQSNIGTVQCTVVAYNQNVPSINVWKKCSITILTANSGNVWFRPYVYTGGSATFDLWASELSLTEGKVETPWTANDGELLNGNTVIDAKGVTIYNGGLLVKNNAGQEVLKGDSNGNLTGINGKFKILNDIGSVGFTGNGLEFGDMRGNNHFSEISLVDGNTNNPYFYYRNAGATFSGTQHGLSKFKVLDMEVCCQNGLNLLSGGGDYASGAPWYGLGRTSFNMEGGTSTAVQLAGYTGVRIRTGECGLDVNVGSNRPPRLWTNHGGVRIGPQNPSHCHYETDRDNHWFNKMILVNGNIETYGAGQNFVAKNDYGYMGRDTSGVARYMMYLASNNHIRIGYNAERYIESFGHFKPAADNAYYLGIVSPAGRWKQLCAVSGTINGSDSRFKNNIRPIVKDSSSRRNALSRIGKKVFKTVQPSEEEATGIDYYNFLKNVFQPYAFDYNMDIEDFKETKEFDKETKIGWDPKLGKTNPEDDIKQMRAIGFVADEYDLETDKVAKEFIFRTSDGKLNYNTSNYTTMVAIALKEAIDKIETLETENNDLSIRLDNIESLIETKSNSFKTIFHKCLSTCKHKLKF